jgi:hypothetical protein
MSHQAIWPGADDRLILLGFHITSEVIAECSKAVTPQETAEEYHQHSGQKMRA